MKLFNRNTGEAFADKAAQGVAGGILKMQRGFSERMSKWSVSWKRKGQIIFLAVVSCVFVSLSVVAIVRPFTTSYTTERPAPIKVVRPAAVDASPRITDEEFQRIQQFKSRLDSAIIQQRPGLMDSIRMVEELYYSQK